MWEADRQVVLSQLHNVLLALRSNGRLCRQSRFAIGGGGSARLSQIYHQEHPLLRDVLHLQRCLFRSVGIKVGCHRESGTAIATCEPVVPELYLASPPYSPCGHGGSEVAHDARVSPRTSTMSSAGESSVLSEREILQVFCDVCCSAATNETITSVALHALVTFLELPCSFLTLHGVRMAMDAATRAQSELTDIGSHEVLLSRTMHVYLAALRHPAASVLPEDLYVSVVRHMLMVSLQPEASPLLRRTAENLMKSVVTLLYTRVILTARLDLSMSCTQPSQDCTASATLTMDGLRLPGADNEGVAPPSLTLTGACMLRFVSALIRGDTAVANAAGGPASLNEEASAATAGAELLEQPGEVLRCSPAAVIRGEPTALQLEGLWLAQAALLVMQRRLGTTVIPSLRHAIQHELSRSLLLAGVGEANVIVLAQILRTVHLVVQCAAPLLVPQMFSFLRVLHLHPLVTLTDDLAMTETGTTPSTSALHFLGSPVGRGGGPLGLAATSSAGGGSSSNGSGGYGGGTMYGGGAATATAAPGATVASPVLPRSPAQVLQMHEQREALLESLAEFCGDPSFAVFCYAHYDLSVHYIPLLPQLCEVLAQLAPCAGASLPCTENDERDECQDDDTSQAQVRQSAVEVHVDQGEAQHEDRVAKCVELHATTMASVRPVQGARSTALTPSPRGAQPSQGRPGPTMAEPTTRTTVTHIQLTAVTALYNLLFSLAAALRTVTPGSWTPNEAIEQAVWQKQQLLCFAELFAEAPLKKGIPFLLEHALRVTPGTEAEAMRRHNTLFVLAEPGGGREVGQALYRLSRLLNKRVLGDYIGDLGRDQTGSSSQAAEASEPQGAPDAMAGVGSVEFYKSQLEGFIEQFDFRHKPLLIAIRELVYRLCLPGESQKIDRVMEATAKHWYAMNHPRLSDDSTEMGGAVDETAVAVSRVNPFHSEEGAFVLSFAIIMLNTDLHSGKLRQSMTADEFRNMNRGIDEGKNVPDDYLLAVYEDVKQHEVIMADMLDRGFANDVTWDLQMRPPDLSSPPCMTGVDEEQRESDENLVSTRCRNGRPGDGCDARTLAPYVFRSLWKRLLYVFSDTLHGTAPHLARMTVCGESVAAAMAAARQVMPNELSAFCTALHGLCLLCETASTLLEFAMVSRALQPMLRYTQFDLHRPDDALEGVHEQLPVLLCVKALGTFTLRSTVWDAVAAVKATGTTASPPSSSSPSPPVMRRLVRLLCELYLIGAMADAVDDGQNCSAEEPAVCARRTALYGLAALSDALRHDPRLMREACLDSYRRAVAPAHSGEGGAGGWLSALWGGGGGEGSGGGGEGHRTAAKERAERRRQCNSRTREAVPSMEQLLRTCATMSPGAHLNLVTALSEEAKMQTTTSLDGVAASFKTWLLCALVAQAPCAAACLMTTFDCLRHNLTRVFTVLDIPVQGHDAAAGATCSPRRGTTTGTDAATGAATVAARPRSVISADAHRRWWGLAQRMVQAIVHLAESSTASGTQVTALLQFLHETATTTNSPSGAALVMAALSRFLYDWAVRLSSDAAVSRATTPQEMNTLVDFTCRTAALMTGRAVVLEAALEAGVVRRLRAVLFHTSKYALYDVARLTETVMQTAFDLGMRASRQTKLSTIDATAHRSPRSDRVVSYVVPGEDGGGEGATATASSSDEVLEQGTAAETISHCTHNLLCLTHSPAQGRSKELSNGGGNVRDDKDSGSSGDSRVSVLWMNSLRNLSTLVLRSAAAREGAEALLNLQRSLLDTALPALPPSTLHAMYADILFPLAGRLCESRTASAAIPAACGEGRTAVSPATRAASEGTSAPREVASRSMLLSLFHTFAPPPPGRSGQGKRGNGSVDANDDGESRHGEAAAQAAAGCTEGGGHHDNGEIVPHAVRVEVKCRVLNLLPKPLLQHITSLCATPDVLSELWRRVLATLYAVYMAYAPNDDTRASATAVAREAAGVTDPSRVEEATLVREAVEETVKNMIYVIAATLKDDTTQARLLPCEAPSFWTATRDLVRPFHFSGPLLDFMSTLLQGASGPVEKDVHAPDVSDDDEAAAATKVGAEVAAGDTTGMCGDGA